MKLKPDDVFIYPTDTVWGIGASIYSHEGYKKIARIKQTSEHKPLSVMFTNIKDLTNNFNLPKELNGEWLTKFFQMESTLGIPVVMAKIPIPEWVIAGSDVVSVRVLEHEILKVIHDDLLSPFFTTSLNITGTPPITEYAEAREFHVKQAHLAHFYGDDKANLSGHSSTIVFLRNNEFEIVRGGKRIDEITAHLKASGLNVKS
jgi:L-threonylcarbamoyladenylate synthase